jgi:cellobiose phosphorylase
MQAILPLSPPRGTVAGYGLFEQNGGPPELLLHPTARPQIFLLPMTQSIIGGLFTSQQAEHHLIIREHLDFPDGVRRWIGRSLIMAA